LRRGAALSLLAFVALAAPAYADLSLRASARVPGRIALRVHAAPGTQVEVKDGLTGATRSFTPSREETVLRRFAVWSCAGAARSFTAVQGGVSAAAQVRTPTCARRLALGGPRSLRAPRRGVLVLRDRWRIGGVAARFCVRPPGAGRHCSHVRLRAGQQAAELALSALRPGAYRLFAVNRFQRLHGTLRAQPPGGHLRLLATGDSMIQIVDSFLAQRLPPVAVRSDARISTGISKPALLDWNRHSRAQVTRIRPDLTVVFLGANDGFPLAGRDCCGLPWIAEYARRAREMMRTYARGGRGRVYWLLLPAPRSGFFKQVYPAVNTALRQAAAGLEDDVRIVELDRVFTPRGRYRASMRVGGKRVRVRQRDGIHLSTAGAALAAELVAQAVRQDRMLP
jgi:lysophospholipase L1-like esterase